MRGSTMNAHARKFARIAASSGSNGVLIYVGGVQVAAGAGAIVLSSRTARRKLAKATRHEAGKGGER